MHQSIINTILIGLLANGIVAKQSNPYILGISDAQAKLYLPKPGNKFSCFNDSSKVFDFSIVNDNYCDCEDGSDEPGTSACQNNVFHCKNVGFKPATLLSSRVNDGICDPECCDGSDEYDGKVQCPNMCKEVAKTEKEREEKEQKLITQGLTKKKEYIEHYSEFIAKTKKEIKDLEVKVEEARVTAEDLKKQKEIYEVQEKDNESSGSKRVEELVNKFNDLKELTLKYKSDLEHLQQVLKELKENHNQNYHDMAVKGAITAYDDFVSSFVPVDETTDYRLSEETLDETNPDVPNNNDASSKYWDANRVYEDLKNDLKQLEDRLTKDFGVEGEYAALNEKCFDFVDGEYTYTACLFGSVTQVSKNGDNINLGKFSSWEKNYGIQKYTDGTYCWNGPNRSVTLHLACGGEEKITAVTEPAKCEYVMHMVTPAACKSKKFEKQGTTNSPPILEDAHDEL